MDVCEVCKKNKAIETHHINYQINADNNGNFSNFNKNNTHNLVCICEECHQKEHQGLIGIIGYKQTSEGRESACAGFNEVKNCAGCRQVHGVGECRRVGGFTSTPLRAHAAAHPRRFG
jgi:hypothetical protein